MKAESARRVKFLIGLPGKNGEEKKDKTEQPAETQPAETQLAETQPAELETQLDLVEETQPAEAPIAVVPVDGKDPEEYREGGEEEELEIPDPSVDVD